MIIGKELIDAQINAKKAAKEAYDKELLKAILANVDKLKALRQDVRDIMETYFYVIKVDKAAADAMWKAMCRTIPDLLGIDLVNALTDGSWETKYAFRPGLDKSGCNREVYVSSSEVYFSPTGNWKELQPICDIKTMLDPKSYESTLNSIILLIDAIPKYKDKLTKMMPEFLKK